MPEMTPEAAARYALDHDVARGDLSMPAQLAYDQLVRDGYGAPAEEPDAVFPALGVQVRGDAVESHLPGDRPRPLGPLAGAQAQVTDGQQTWSPGRALVLPMGMAGLATKAQATAFVIFPGGTYHERALDGSKAVGAAQREAVKFNLLARPAATQPPAPAQEDTAATLRKLAGLHRDGLLTDEEYAAKRAEVIDRI